MKRAMRFVLVLALLGNGGVAIAEDDEAAEKIRDLGKTLFETRCVACHGRDAKGHGPAAAALKKPPKDLTKISERYGGEFPKKTIEEIIDGRRATMAHGDRDMPIWGEKFFEEGSAIQPETMVYALAAYLESIQTKK